MLFDLFVLLAVRFVGCRGCLCLVIYGVVGVTFWFAMV